MYDRNLSFQRKLKIGVEETKSPKNSATSHEQQNTLHKYFKPDKNLNQDEGSANKTTTKQNKDSDTSSTWFRCKNKHDGQKRKEMSEDDQNTKYLSSTASNPSFTRLSIKFSDSSDEDEIDIDSKRTYLRSSFSPKSDIRIYREGYPNAKDDMKINDNYEFYTNKKKSEPDGYIQWLFPLQEPGLNWSAQPLQKHEIDCIIKDQRAHERILLSYKLMLDFYGFKLVNTETGEISRKDNNDNDNLGYRSRLHNLNTSSHNYLRITRILKCLGEFDYEHLKFGFLECILRESITENTLNNCLRSCRDYWIQTLRSKQDRQSLKCYANKLIQYRNECSLPPVNFRPKRSQTAIDQSLPPSTADT
ncbi:unnamed protein product [Didymodactylos carnosus]|uniref:Opioid growth factor receptor (OGFr) conserved domain-containing protein n=1 Tax=Didymodactylos carnosus TaxID=1234261 RepID=A0A815S7S4_9BILA|nr:unnamed protein product [Didymodactylos carnosus]CAF1488249.1 unnamed protein product [Didymodactylos carnosus]CAF4188160.1 unnamed protein product [Didymodactylos carnosus]CAF4351904.1 unnamed protein product [Didymodactylos carnosus]